MKKIAILLVNIMLILSIVGCSNNTTATTSGEIEPKYLTQEEWSNRYQVREYKEKEKLDSIPI